MSAYRAELIKLLSSGECYSGNDLARRFGVSRTAIWKQFRAIEAMGLPVERQAARGYRLLEPFVALSAFDIEAALGPVGRRWFPRVDVHSEIESTNEWIATVMAEGAVSGTVSFAEYQYAGRGRRGRSWQAAYGQSLCFSVLWRYQSGPAAFGALSLAVAVALWRALNRSGVAGIGIKWPNDLVYQGAKLAGILLEMQGESAGPSSVIIGVGLNVNLTDGVGIDQRWCSLADLKGAALDRNRLAAALLLEIGTVLSEYERSGFSGVAEDFKAADVLAGRQVMLVEGGQAARSVEVLRVAPDGALIVSDNTGDRRVYSGEVSVREWVGVRD
ncbi:MAG: biotin--[acetyl-CoA-carboxylase] ligase [Gammaproteobacteria bacterium]|nr:biotin--[acetyl-CoA-carboxylase] ligase [Gammaproteobacteria bacterium]